MNAEAAFWHFHSENPHVLTTLLALARQAKRERRDVGMRCLWERLRWELSIPTSEKQPRLNNNYAPYYARLINATPDLSGFFELRNTDKNPYFLSGLNIM